MRASASVCLFEGGGGNARVVEGVMEREGSGGRVEGRTGVGIERDREPGRGKGVWGRGLGRTRETGRREEREAEEEGEGG